MYVFYGKTYYLYDRKRELIIQKGWMNGSQNNTLIKLYETTQTVFSASGIAMLLGENRGGVVSKRMSHYVRDGRLLNPRRGFYAKKGYNPEELACMIFIPSYLSLEYVLQKAGVVFQFDSRLTAVSYLSRDIEADGREYSYRKMRGEILADVRGIENHGNVNIASVERAFLDMMYLNAEYYFDNLRALDYKKVMELLPLYGNKCMEQHVKRMFGKQ